MLGFVWVSLAASLRFAIGGKQAAWLVIINSEDLAGCLSYSTVLTLLSIMVEFKLILPILFIL